MREKMSDAMCHSENDEEFLHRILQFIENEPNVKLDMVDIRPGCSIGDNYMSCVRRVTINGHTANHHYKKLEHVLIMKVQPECQARREAFRCHSLFLNESAFYNRVIPALQEYTEDRTPLPFPVCYYASTNAIILDDLTLSGYRMSNRKCGVDYNHCKIAFQVLGRFHAASLAMKHLHREEFDRLHPSVQEVIFSPEAINVHGVSIENALKLAVSKLKLTIQPGESHLEEAVKKLQNYQGRVFETMRYLVSAKEPLSVIMHGDFWTNNMLFKYKENGKALEVSDVKFVDLQVSRYGSPAIDILHFLYSSLQPGILEAHYDDILKVYHESLTENLYKLAPTAPKITLQDVISEVETHAMYGMFMGFLLLPAVTAETTAINMDTVDNNVSQEFLDKAECNLTANYEQRVRNMVIEFTTRGFL